MQGSNHYIKSLFWTIEFCSYQKASSLWACRWNLESHWRWHSWCPLWRGSLWSSWSPISSWRETELSRSLRNHFIKIIFCFLDLRIRYNSWQLDGFYVVNIIISYILNVIVCEYKGCSIKAKNEMMKISWIFICCKSFSLTSLSLCQIISIFVLIITNYIPDVSSRHHQEKEDAPRQFSPTGHRKGINYILLLEINNSKPLTLTHISHTGCLSVLLRLWIYVWIHT